MAVLTLNSGSSSLKFALYEQRQSDESDVGARVSLSGVIERIGLHESRAHARDAAGKTLIETQINARNHQEAM